MRVSRPFAALTCAAALVAFASSARASSTEVTGTISTADGRPLPHLVVTLTGPDESARAVSGPDGRFRAHVAAAGEYVVAVDAPGFIVRSGSRATVGTDGRAQPIAVVLAAAPVRERVLVAATRSEAVGSTLGVSAHVIEGDALAEREPSSLVQALQEVPGMAAARAGGVGTQASVFVRGGVSNFARVLVDGVPVNEPGGAFDFGAVPALALERVEVVRGAASSLYGTDALAGVVHLVTRRAPSVLGSGGHAEAEAGGNDWQRLAGGASARGARLDGNIAVARLATDNAEPNSRFEQTAAAGTAGLVRGALSLRAFARGEDSTVGTPGATAFGRPDLDASFARRNLVLGGEATAAGERLAHTVRLGMAASNQLSLNPLASEPFVPRYGDRVAPFTLYDFPSEGGYRNGTRRASASYQVEAPLGGRHLLTGGIDVERETGRLSSGEGPGLIEPARTNAGAYLQDRVVVGTRAFLTLGGRVERNASFGTRAVPRAAVAFRMRGGADATTLRASAGAGIKEPSFLESFGAASFARGNPDLQAEQSRTADVGLEQRLFGSRLRLEVSAFRHDYRDQIAYQVTSFTPFEGTYVNLGESRAQGVEMVMEAAPTPALAVSAHYTLTDSEVRVSTTDFDPVYAEGEALLRRPRHQGSLTARAQRGRMRVAATLVRVGERVDSDFLGLGLAASPAYTRVDARAHIALPRGGEVYLVGENVLDHEYMEVLGYPALGRSLRLGLRLRVGAQRER